MRPIRSTFLLLATAMVAAAPAWAGEVNGSTSNPKDDFSQGASICIFSGLNDDPTGTLGQGPGGKTQNYGQDVSHGYVSPLNPDDPAPGFLCNPNNVPMKPIGH